METVKDIYEKERKKYEYMKEHMDEIDVPDLPEALPNRDKQIERFREFMLLQQEHQMTTYYNAWQQEETYNKN